MSSTLVRPTGPCEGLEVVQVRASAGGTPGKMCAALEEHGGAGNDGASASAEEGCATPAGGLEDEAVRYENGV